MDNASEFALDIQEMCQKHRPDPKEFLTIVEKYGGKWADGATLNFSDGSVARWDGSGWELNPKGD